MRRSPTIFSVYMPSDHATSSNVTLGPRGCKFACITQAIFQPRLDGLPHLPGVRHLHVNRPLSNVCLQFAFSTGNGLRLH